MTNLQNNTQETEQLVKRGRGRPKGSKNKIKIAPGIGSIDSDATGAFSSNLVQAPIKRRGRPKGSKNKIKKEQETPTVALTLPVTIQEAQSSDSGVSTVFVQVALPSTEEKLELHPILEAAKWLEKKMPVIEVQYYRQRASKQSITLTTAIALGILGLFNVQDQEIRKQIKI